MCILILSLQAKEEAVALKVCPAFNNMRHSKNTHDVMLAPSKKYTILKYYKGQALVLLKGEQPAQRWVDQTCFTPLVVNEETSIEEEVSRDISLMLYGTKEKSTVNTNRYNISEKNLLALSWHNTFCKTHRFKKECKKPNFPISNTHYKDQNFVLHGLWPQPKNKNYCNINSRLLSLDKYKQWHRLPDLNLSREVKNDLNIFMPGVASNLHKHQWIKHGTCYGTDANRYFKDAISLVKQMNTSNVGKFFRKNIGKRVTLQQLRTLFNRSFGVGTGQRVELKCKNGLISELWLHLGGGSDDLAILLKRGQSIRSRCQGGLLDKAGF